MHHIWPEGREKIPTAGSNEEDSGCALLGPPLSPEETELLWQQLLAAAQHSSSKEKQQAFAAVAASAAAGSNPAAAVVAAIRMAISSAAVVGKVPYYKPGTAAAAATATAAATAAAAAAARATAVTEAGEAAAAATVAFLEAAELLNSSATESFAKIDVEDRMDVNITAAEAYIKGGEFALAEPLVTFAAAFAADSKNDSLKHRLTDSRLTGSNWLSLFRRIIRDNFITKEDAEAITKMMDAEGQITSAAKTAIIHKSAEEFVVELLTAGKIAGRIDAEKGVLHIFSEEAKPRNWRRSALDVFTDLHRLAEALDA
ncbi:hypothetical protein, conserved [Eimeria maxima]|uniref:PCI domain-containing protein n=1 Tax=Eimeria maxima TaxID=5804 RepID=U6M6S5_EIMMA|nr:hypothetical protein, conserved [Eimeria maxima]CDJ59721.1 hypothetical protein, conserved [Eimeria maxima]